MIVVGLVLFGLGSAVAALSTSIGGVIIGRALQGAGAVGSVILALVADYSEENRTKAMAMVGITIGASFMVALGTGPIVANFIGVPGIFWLMVVLALVGIAITQLAVPNPPPARTSRRRNGAGVDRRGAARRELLRLDLGIFALHAMLTAAFWSCPALCATRWSSGPRSVDGLFAGFARFHRVMLPAIIVAEKSPDERRLRERGRRACGKPGHALFRRANLFVLLAALIIFFSAFNVMEATLPSLITKAAPPDAKGTAMGLYSSLQFLGIFVGGVIGGFVHQHGGEWRVCPYRRDGAGLARRSGHDGAAELSDDATGADRGRQGREAESLAANAAGAGCGRSRGHP